MIEIRALEVSVMHKSDMGCVMVWLVCWANNSVLGGSNPHQFRNLCSSFCSIVPLVRMAIKLTVHSVARLGFEERTGHKPLFAEEKKMNSLTSQPP